MALINALEIAKKKIDKIKIVINGAGVVFSYLVKLYVALWCKNRT